MNTTILLEQLTLLDNQLQYSKQEVEFWKKKYEDLNLLTIEVRNSLKQDLKELQKTIEQINNDRIYWKNKYDNLQLQSIQTYIGNELK